MNKLITTSLTMVAVVAGFAAAQPNVGNSPAHLRFTLKGQAVKEYAAGVHWIALSNSGTHLATGDYRGTLTVWDAVKGTQLFKDVDPNDDPQLTWVGPIVFTPDGKTVVAANDRGEIKLWDVAGGKRTGELAGHKDAIRLLSFLADGQTLVTGDSGGIIRFWDMNTRKELAKRRVQLGIGESRIYFEHMAVSRDGKTIVSASRQKLSVWDVPSAKQTAVLDHDEDIARLALSPDASTLIVGVGERRATFFRIWDLKKLTVRVDFDGPVQPITALHVTQDGKTIITGCQDGSVKLFDLATGGERLALQGSTAAAVGDLAASADGKTIVAGRFDDNTVSVWQLPEAPSTIAARAVKKHRRMFPWDSKERRTLAYEADILGGQGARGIAALIAKLDGDDPNWQNAALVALKDLGPNGAGAVDALIRLVESEDARLSNKQLAIEVLTDMGPAAKKAVPALVAATKETRDHDRSFRSNGPSNVSHAATLAIMGIDPPAIVPVFQEALARGAVLDSAHSVIWKLGPAADPLLPKFREFLAGEADRRRLALELLPEFGETGMAIYTEHFLDPKTGNALRIKLLNDLGGGGKALPSRIRILKAVLRSDDAKLRLAGLQWLSYRSMPEVVPELTALLDDEAIEKLSENLADFERMPVARALGNQGKTAAAHLAKALAHEKPLVRRNAVQALSRMKKGEAEAAIPSLELALDDEDFSFRAAAAKAILKSGQIKVKALAVLERHLQAGDPHLVAALRIVGDLGIAGRPLFPALKRVTLQAHIGLGLKAMCEVHGNAKEIVEVWTQIVVQTPRFAMFPPVEELALHGKLARPAVPALLARLKDEFGRHDTFEALKAIGPAAAPAIPEMLRLLDDRGSLFSQPLGVLGAMGDEAQPAVAPLMKRFDAIQRDKNEGEAGYQLRSILTALENIGPGSAEAVPWLIELVPEYPQAIKVLGKIGPKAKAAVPMLEKIYQSDRSASRAWCAFALARITGQKDPYVVYLAEELSKSKQRSHRETAIQALVALGPDARPALPALLEAVKEKATFEFGKVDFRYEAALALVHFGPDARAAVPHLVDLAETNSWVWGPAAADALGAIGPAAKDALPALKRLAEREERHTRVIERAIARIRGK